VTGRPARLVMQNDGNLVIYEGNRPLWASASQPKPAAVPTAQPQAWWPKNFEDLGKLSIKLSANEIQTLIGNAGAGLIGNAGAGLVGGSGGALTATHPLAQVAPLANVTPFTMPIGNNLTLPGGNTYRTQATVDPKKMVTEAFKMVFGRNPTVEELNTWVDFYKKYPKSTVASSAGNLAQSLSYLLILPAGEIQRKGMVQTAVPLVFNRAPTQNELSIWSERIQRDRMRFNDLVSALRRGAPQESSPPKSDRGGGRRGQQSGG